MLFPDIDLKTATDLLGNIASEHLSGKLQVDQESVYEFRRRNYGTNQDTLFICYRRYL